jgi:hypothetical protein
MAANESAPQKSTSRVSEEEEKMRAIECPCGHRFEGADDEELFRLCREHVDLEHPEMERSNEQIRERIATDAYETAVA